MARRLPDIEGAETDVLAYTGDEQQIEREERRDEIVSGSPLR
jgi:hypothetical protein